MLNKVYISNNEKKKKKNNIKQIHTVYNAYILTFYTRLKIEINYMMNFLGTTSF